LNRRYHASLSIRQRFDGPSDDRPTLQASNLQASGDQLPKSRLPTRRRPVLSTCDSNSSQQSGALRRPDRFVPTRSSSSLDLATQTFRANKDPASLTPDEKLLRNKCASWDSFNPRRRVTSPIPRALRPTERRNVSGNRSGGGGKFAVFSFQISR
jgi:meiosis-specific APC/C activator protein AMA1